MDYHVLGPLEVADGEWVVPLSTSKERKLLAILLINENHVVSADRLLEEIWGADEPASGLKALRYHVSKLRDSLYPGRSELTQVALRTQSPGYILDVGPDALDAARFGRLVENARAAMEDDVSLADELLRKALALWRGLAWVDFRFDEFAQPAIWGLEEARLEAVELLMQVGLDLGRHHQLREQLGLEPSTELQDLEERILRQDAALRGTSMLVVDTADVPGTALPSVWAECAFAPSRVPRFVRELADKGQTR